MVPKSAKSTKIVSLKKKKGRIRYVQMHIYVHVCSWYSMPCTCTYIHTYIRVCVCETSITTYVHVHTVRIKQTSYTYVCTSISDAMLPMNADSCRLQLNQLGPQVLGGPSEVANLSIGVQPKHLRGLGKGEGVDVIQIVVLVPEKHTYMYIHLSTADAHYRYIRTCICMYVHANTYSDFRLIDPNMHHNPRTICCLGMAE